MKSSLYIILCMIFALSLSFVGCTNVSHTKYPSEMTSQEFFNYEISKSEIVDSAGHMFYLYETGTRGYRNYSFDLEHRVDCKKCLDIFD